MMLESDHGQPFWLLEGDPKYMVVEFDGAIPSEFDPVLDHKNSYGELRSGTVDMTYRYAGGKVSDYTRHWTVYCFGLLSAPLHELLMDGGATGYSVQPALVTRRRGTNLERLAMVVSGRCEIDWQMRKVETRTSLERAPMPEIPRGATVAEIERAHSLWRENLVEVQRTYGVGLSFVQGSWDGCDIFANVGGGSWLFCTDRVRRLIAASGMTGCEFQALDDYESMLP